MYQILFCLLTHGRSVYFLTLLKGISARLNPSRVFSYKISRTLECRISVIEGLRVWREVGIFLLVTVVENVLVQE